MANMTAGGVYQQMVVPDPYHYHQPQCQLVPAITHQVGLTVHTETKKETKRKKKVVDKSMCDKKKVKNSTQNNSASKTEEISTSTTDRKGHKPEVSLCPVCNKRKCYKHLDAKSRIHLSKKTPDDVIIVLKKHMLKLLSNQDLNSFCKVDPKSNKVDVDISKMHQSYLEEFEPQTLHSQVSQDNKDAKPKVKKWLYRKVFLDEFKTFEFGTCKTHLGELRRGIDNYLQQKKKKLPKPKTASHPSNPNQIIPQDYSLSNHNGQEAELQRPGLHPGVIHPAMHDTSAGYQPNLMSIGVEASTIVPSSTVTVGGAAPTLHNSLTTYVTHQVPTNLLFGLGQQQQTSTQQQPLNLQTSHPPPIHPPGGHQPPPGMPPSVTHSTSAPPLPLNLHNPYYVSFGPMLPLHMSPQHSHQQQFQPNLMQPQSQHNFNQHAMYQ